MSCEAKHICLNCSCHFQAVLDGSGGNRPGQVGTIWKTHFQVQAKRYTSLLWYWLLKPLCRGFGVQLDYRHDKNITCIESYLCSKMLLFQFATKILHAKEIVFVTWIFISTPKQSMPLQYFKTYISVLIKLNFSIALYLSLSPPRL